MPDPPSSPLPTVRVTVLRPDDLLNLEISGVNLRLDAGDPAAPALVVADQQQPALLVVTFPPQTTFEQAFYDAVNATPVQVLGPGDKPRPATPDTGPPHPPGDVESLMSGPTRLVFRLPTDARIPYSISGLLDWSTFELVVAPVADVPAGQKPLARAHRPRAGRPRDDPPAAVPAAPLAHPCGGLAARDRGGDPRRAGRALAHPARPGATPTASRPSSTSNTPSDSGPSGRRTTSRASRCPRPARPGCRPAWRRCRTRTGTRSSS